MLIFFYTVLYKSSRPSTIEQVTIFNPDYTEMRSDLHVIHSNHIGQRILSITNFNRARKGKQK